MSQIDLDSISLEQALIDFEVANARVIDLARRVTSLSEELLKLRGQLEAERTRSAKLSQELAALRTSNVLDEHTEHELYILSALRESRALKIAALFAPRLRNALRLR